MMRCLCRGATFSILLCWAALDTQPVDAQKSGSRQNPPTPCAWERTFGGAREDKAFAITPMPDGGSVVVGHASSFGGFRGKAWVLRLDAAGAGYEDMWVVKQPYCDATPGE